jgi:hypothetical protein
MFLYFCHNTLIPLSKHSHITLSPRRHAPYQVMFTVAHDIYPSSRLPSVVTALDDAYWPVRHSRHTLRANSGWRDSKQQKTKLSRRSWQHG